MPGGRRPSRTYGTLYHLDWPRLLADRNLDHAVLAEVDDDVAVNGCRPEFVRHGDAWLLATSDYGPAGNAVRLYDPVKLAAARRTTEPGVLRATLPCGPWVQSLCRVDSRGLLVLIQDQIEGRRWRLTLADPWDGADLRQAPAFDIPGHADELEGFTVLTGNACLFVTSSRENNIWSDRIRLPTRATAAQ